MKDRLYSNKIKDVLDAAMANLKPLIDSDIIIGKAIKTDLMEILLPCVAIALLIC